VRGMTPDRATRLGLWAIVAVSLALLAYLVAAAFGLGGQLPVDQCVAVQPLGRVTGPPLQPTSLPDGAWGWILGVLCLAGFLVGQLWGIWRSEYHSTLRSAAAAGSWGDAAGDQTPPSTTLQVLLLVVFTVGAAALAWETFAVAHVETDPRLWPVTFFVRCAFDAATVPTIAAAVVVSTMAGHWLGSMAGWRRVR
jgi:hypothetical protein